MTLAKLRLTKDAVCWDVGAGTGSVSVEMAECCEDGTVYAIEQNEEACRLIHDNMRRFAKTNIRVISGRAPECLEDLPAPARVFGGGSNGSLTEILRTALRKNPAVRIVRNTVTVDTFTEAASALKTLTVKNPEIVQISVSRARPVGSVQMMTAQNPVTVISFDGGMPDV